MIARQRARVPRSTHAEHGAISPLVIGLAVALLVIAGLVVDGGGAITARQKVFDDAEQAARAGANQIDVEALRSSGEVVLLQDAASQQASQFAAQHFDYGGGQVQVSTTPEAVTVTITDTVQTRLLSLVGFHEFNVDGQATAEATAGIG
ncbi:MAG TPA: pilus assembly protein TadG-related protein [Jiangellaceae bacterium]|nr:pilus assembly protein TadG-related protein [Jiangellaceae bacterium]